jgi:hypothetical protein
MLYVQFDALGRAAVIYDTPRDGAEPVEGLDRVFLARHRRNDEVEWVAREPEPEYQPTPEDIADQEAAQLATQREAMVCSRLQGRLVLGEAVCAIIDGIAADPETPWAMRETIANAIEWRRTSQAMTELGYLLGYTDDQMDGLFMQAMQVAV